MDVIGGISTSVKSQSLFEKLVLVCRFIEPPIPQIAEKTVHLVMKDLTYVDSNGKSQLSLYSIMFSMPFRINENIASIVRILVNSITWVMVAASSKARVANDRSSSEINRYLIASTQALLTALFLSVLSEIYCIFSSFSLPSSCCTLPALSKTSCARRDR